MSRLDLSRRLAYFFGLATPLAETLRRRGTWWDNVPAFLDDYILGAFLIAGALATRKRSAQSRALLAAAWGFACAMAYSSVAFHWFSMRSGQPDPAGIPTQWVFAIKVFGGLVFVGALIMTVTTPGIGQEQTGSANHHGEPEDSHLVRPDA